MTEFATAVDSLVRTINYLDESRKGIKPFDFYDAFARYLNRVSGEDFSGVGVSLDNYTELFWEFLREYDSMTPEVQLDFKIIRDLLVTDRLTTNASGRTPDFLKVEDERLRKVKVYLEQSKEFKPPKATRRGIAILYSTSQVLFVDYTEKNPVTGMYDARYIDLEEALKGYEELVQ